MKIKCDRSTLTNGFSVAALCAPKGSPKPILRNVKIVADGDGLVLSATDMEIGVEVAVSGVDVIRSGAILANAALLGSILRESSDDFLTIESDETGTVVRGERSVYKLQCENPDEFPAVSNPIGESYHEIKAGLLKELFQRTVFATDTESSRYALGGVLLEFQHDKLTAIATDGRRLAVMEGPASSVGEKGGESHVSTIIPARAIQLLLRVVGNGSGPVQISASENNLVARIGDTTVMTRLVEGRFPKWRDIIPTNRGGVEVESAVGSLYSTLRQASIVSSQESRGLSFEFSDGTLAISGSTAEIGTSRAELPIAYEGNAISISMDHRFVADFLKVLDSSACMSMDVLNTDSPVVFKTGDGYLYLVMPLASGA